MTISQELTKLQTNLANSYTAVDNKGGTLPASQNFDNLATAIDSISTGGVGIPRVIENGEFKTGAESWEFPSGVTSIGDYACYYAQYNNANLTSVSGCENITEVGDYGFSYCFSGNTSLNHEFDFSKVETVGSYGFSYCWQNCNLQSKKIDLSGVKTVGDHGFAYAFYYKNGNKNIDIRNMETAGDYAFQRAFAIPSYDSNAAITVTKFEKLTSVGSYCFEYAFLNSNPDNIQFLALESITKPYVFSNCWSSCDRSNSHKIWHPFPVLKSIEGSYVFQNAFTYFRGKALIFDSLETISTSMSKVSVFQGAFRYALLSADSGENNKVTGLFAFPCLKIVGDTSGQSYSNFKQAAISSNQSVHFDGPELETINNRLSTSSSGQFSACGFIRVYMPKLTAMNGYPQYVFYNSTTTTELHFGKENQATIEAINGYASKFGASNATIYFDLINHITVNGVVYDRYGKEYDYDTAHFSWKNGDDIIYTTEEWTPAVGDSTYTKSGDSYVSTGQTITAVA